MATNKIKLYIGPITLGIWLVFGFTGCVASSEPPPTPTFAPTLTIELSPTHEPIPTEELTATIEPTFTVEPSTPIEPTKPSIKVALLGENRGDLASNSHDKWVYEGRTGEIIRIVMTADNSPDNTDLPQAKWAEAGYLDTELVVLSPSGTGISKATDGLNTEGGFVSDAEIEAIYLSRDGQYEIQARSSKGAGEYTLRIESLDYAVDPTMVDEYIGHYVEGPWKFDVYIKTNENGFYLEVPQENATYALLPFDVDKFIVEDGSIFHFTRDESGAITGYEVLLAIIHPGGGEWYSAPRVQG